MRHGAAREAYQRAELRLRELLFGDAVFSGGRLRGEEARDRARQELRRMRTAFDEAVELAARPGEATNLDEELRDAAVRATRSEQAVADERGLASLIKLIDDDELSGHAIRALCALGPKRSIPYLEHARPRLEAVLARDTASDFAKRQARKALARVDHVRLA